MVQKAIILLLILLSCTVRAQSIEFEPTTDGIWVKENEEPVFFYQKTTKSHHGKYPRANYIHPLFNLDGAVLTEDFPEGHEHHRGIFWTWHQVLIGDQPMGDPWDCEDFTWDVYEVAGRPEDNTLSAKTYWKSPHWTNEQGEMVPFVDETLEVTIHPKTEAYRVFDFEISLLALVPGVKIGGKDHPKAYGGFSVRMKMPEDIRFASIEGAITPQTEPVSAGPWMNISASLAADGGPAGVIIMNYPQNPPPDQLWILRREGSMQNPVYPGRDPVPVSTEEPTVLRYRLVVYQDALPEETIHSIYQALK